MYSWWNSFEVTFYRFPFEKSQLLRCILTQLPWCRFLTIIGNSHHLGNETTPLIHTWKLQWEIMFFFSLVFDSNIRRRGWSFAETFQGRFLDRWFRRWKDQVESSDRGSVSGISKSAWRCSSFIRIYCISWRCEFKLPWIDTEGLGHSLPIKTNPLLWCIFTCKNSGQSGAHSGLDNRWSSKWQLLGR